MGLRVCADLRAVTFAQKRLKLASPVGWALERIFLAAQYLFPVAYFGKSRQHMHERLAQGRASPRDSLRRGRKVEWYMLGWATVEILLIMLSPSHIGAWGLTAAVAAMYRMADVLQTAINVNVFDRFRVRSPHYVSSIARAALLSLWNFFEAILCFAVVYQVLRPCLPRAESRLDALYFSVVTQLTIGYGDISPTGVAKILVVAQAGTGFLLAVIAVGRFVSFLPQPRSLIRDE